MLHLADAISERTFARTDHRLRTQVRVLRRTALARLFVVVVAALPSHDNAGGPCIFTPAGRSARDTLTRDDELKIERRKKREGKSARARECVSNATQPLRACVRALCVDRVPPLRPVGASGGSR